MVIGADDHLAWPAPPLPVDPVAAAAGQLPPGGVVLPLPPAALGQLGHQLAAVQPLVVPPLPVGMHLHGLAPVGAAACSEPAWQLWAGAMAGKVHEEVVGVVACLWWRRRWFRALLADPCGVVGLAGSQT